MILPSTVSAVRCIVWVMHQGQMSVQLYGHSGLRQVVAELQCSLILASIQQIEFRRPNTPMAEELNRDAAVAGDAGLSMLIERFAQDSGHHELRNAPILFWGFSAAAGFGTTFAALHPDRTIAFVRYHSHRRGSTTSVDRLKTTPTLLVAGGRDQTAGTEDASELWRSGRAAGAPWTLAVEPEAQHSSPEIHEKTVTSLTVPWISAVVRLRLNDKRPLKSVPVGETWLADVSTSETAAFAAFRGDRGAAVWLPDASSAKGWQAVTQPVSR